MRDRMVYIGVKTILTRIILVFALMEAVCIVFPDFELTFSTFFFSDGGFKYARYGEKLSHLSKVISVCVSLLFLVTGTRKLLSSNSINPLGYRKEIYVLSVFIIVSGFMTHIALKPFFDRPRPEHIIEFGGEEEFIPVLTLNSGAKYQREGSFPSGHASVGFCFAAFALFSKRHYKYYVYASLLFGSIISLGRIMYGRHYIGDIAFSGMLSYSMIVLLYQIHRRCDTTRSSIVYLMFVVILVVLCLSMKGRVHWNVI